MSWSRSFRNFIKRHTTSKSEQQALYWSNRLSTIYAFCAWNAMGLAVAIGIYKFNNDKRDDHTPGPSREQVALERSLTWGNFSARVVKPKVKEDEIEATETKS